MTFRHSYCSAIGLRADPPWKVTSPAGTPWRNISHDQFSPNIFIVSAVDGSQRGAAMPRYRIVSDGHVFRIQRNRAKSEWDDYYCFSTFAGQKQDFVPAQYAKHWFFVRVDFATYEEAAARIARLKGSIPANTDEEDDFISAILGATVSEHTTC